MLPDPDSGRESGSDVKNGMAREFDLEEINSAGGDECDELR